MPASYGRGTTAVADVPPRTDQTQNPRRIRAGLAADLPIGQIGATPQPAQSNGRCHASSVRGTAGPVIESRPEPCFLRPGEGEQVGVLALVGLLERFLVATTYLGGIATEAGAPRKAVPAKGAD